MVSMFFFKPLFTVPVAAAITGIIIHFMFHICCISIHKLLYFSLLSAHVCMTFLSAGIATSVSVRLFCFFVLIFISGLFAVTSLSVCAAWFHSTVTYCCSHTGFGVCVCACVRCLSFWCLGVCV
jgi:hypothetical protein